MFGKVLLLNYSSRIRADTKLMELYTVQPMDKWRHHAQIRIKCGSVISI